MSDDLDPPPQLFVLRLWQVHLPNGRYEWRGRLQHAQTNEVRHFRDWPALIPSLLAMLREVNNSAGKSSVDPFPFLPPHENLDEVENF